MKKKVTFLVLHLNYGGVVTSIIKTVNLLVKYYDVNLISIYRFESVNETLISSDVNLTFLLDPKYVPNRHLIKNAIKQHHYFKLLYELLRSIFILMIKYCKTALCISRIDTGIVISTDEYNARLLVRYGKKSIIKMTWEHRHHRNDKNYIAMVKKYYVKLNHILLLTQAALDDYKNFLPMKSSQSFHCIPNFHDERPANLSELKSKNLIFVGRFDPIKGIDRLIQIFKSMDTDWNLILIGDGAELNRMKDLASDSDRIMFYGHQSLDMIQKLMCDSSIFVMTSHSEGLPMVLIEAMACGLPCIAFDIQTGPSELIIDGINGFLIPDNDETMFRNKLTLMMDDYELRKKMQSNLHLSLNRYHSSHVLELWRELLDRLESFS